MRTVAFLSCLFAAVVLLPRMAAAVDQSEMAAGKKKAAACAACHGLDGLSKNPDAPNLAGDNADYIIKQLKAFQAGTRQDERMSIVAQSLSEEDVKQVAAWYSGIKVTAEMPQ
jgi:cytochrome c553